MVVVGWLAECNAWGKGNPRDATPPPDNIKEKYKDKISHTHSESHWTTKKTIKAFLRVLWQHYVKPKMEALGLDPTKQKWIPFWNTYSVHRDASILCWAKAEFVGLIILFVPARCTSELQPLDVAFNLSFKAKVVTLCVSAIAGIVTGQPDNGTQRTDVKLNLSLSYLRPLFVHWLYEALRYIQEHRPKAMLDGLHKPGYTECFNTSHECVALFQEASSLNQDKNLFPSKVGSAPRDA